MEEMLLNWIIEMCDRNVCVSQRRIQLHAKYIASEEGFTTSRGWLEEFLNRNGLPL